MLTIMNTLKNLLFALIIVVGTSVFASAQKEDKPPKKEKPPVVKPGDKDKPKEKPQDDKPKKPEYGASAYIKSKENDWA